MDLAEMRLSTLSKADEESVGFITNPVLDRAINQGCRFVYNRLSQKGQAFFWREGTSGNGGKFNAVANTEGYDLPADTIKVVKVEVRSASSTSPDDYRRVDKINIANEQADTFSPVREGYWGQFGYFIAGTRIYFKPVPKEAFTIRLWDVPRFTKLVLETDTPSFDENYHELACELGSLQLLGKSGESLFDERMKLFQIENAMLDETAENRDQQSEQMVITDQRDNDRYGR